MRIARQQKKRETIAYEFTILNANGAPNLYAEFFTLFPISKIQFPKLKSKYWNPIWPNTTYIGKIYILCLLMLCF